MNLIRYFKFYYKLTRGRILIFISIVISSAFFQVFAGGAMITVLNYGIEGANQNRVAKLMLQFLDILHITGDETRFIFLLFSALFTFYISTVIMIVSVWYTARLQAEIFLEMQKDVAGKLMNVDYQFYLSNNVGTLNNIVVQQIRRVSQSFKFYSIVISNFALSIPFILLPLYMNPILVVMMFFLGLPLLYIVPLINSRTKKYSIESVDELSKLNNILIQVLTHFKYLKSTVTYPAVLKKHLQHSKGIARLFRKLALLGAINEHGLLAYAITYFVLMVYWQVGIMKTPIVGVITILGFIYYASRKIMVIPTSYQKFMNISGAILVCEELKQNLEKHQETLSGKIPPDFTGDLEFKNVSFKYFTGETEVLNNISLTIKEKSSVAFVGGSGAGKSTIVNMVTGLILPTEGEISLNEINFKDLDISALRHGIGYVTQESVIFNDTVSNNISLWDESCTSAKVKEAAVKANADGFIEEFPDKYDELLGDHGLNISGGQRQRITIARELLRDTRMIILDEATSALDSETEQQIRQSIDEYRGEKTMIIIAHRLSTIKNCDHIYVLDQGKVVEDGTYDELYSKDGKFRKMVDSQSLES